MLKVNRLRLQGLDNSLVVRIASAIAILVGVLVLLGWNFHIEVLKAGFPGSAATMKANTAFCFVLSGISLWLLQKGKDNQFDLDREKKTRVNKEDSPRRYVFYFLLSRLFAAAVALVGLLALMQYLFGWNLSINELLFRDSPSTVTTFRPGLMGLNTALNFILISKAIDLLASQKNHRSYWYAQIIGLLAALISLQAIIGYTYKVQVLYGIAPYTTSMALHTAVTFILLCVGIWWVYPDKGFMRVITSNTYGGLLARRLLGAAIAVPLVLGWFIAQGQQAGYYSPIFALSLFAIVLIVIFVFLVWQSAAVIERLCRQSEIERQQANKQIVQLNKNLQRHITELETLLEVIPIGIGIAEDRECQKIKVNPAFAKQLGILSDNASLSISSDEKPTFKVYREGKELSPAELPMQYAATHGVEVLDFEAEIIHENGKIVKLLEYVAPLFDEEGKTRGSVGAFLDITERKQAEALLRNQHKWLEDVLNLMPMPLLFIEPGTARVIFANRAANELAGGEFPQGVSAADYHTVYHYTDAAGERIPNEQMPGVRVARGERLDGLEIKWHTSGGVRSLHIFADSLPAMHGYPATCLLAFQDITNLKQADKALSLGYKRLQLLFSTASDLLSSQQPIALLDSVFHKLAAQIGLDVYFNYLVENERVMRLASFTGISEELAKEIEFLEYGQAVCGTVAQKRRPISVESVQHSSDPKTDLIRSLGITAYYCYPLMAQGRLLGTLSFGSRSRTTFTDNQRGMMQAVCDQIAIAMERAGLITSLQQQTEQLSQANRMKDEFLAILSHELRSPLNAIFGWTQLLRARKLNETQIAKGLETIERNAKAQTQLIEDLLDISRIIRGKLQLNVRTCNLVAIIESAIETVQLAAQAKEIDLRFFLSAVEKPQNLELESTVNSKNPKSGLLVAQHTPTSILVSGDVERLQQIIWNLLSNGIKFTPSGGRVEIKLSTVSSEEKQGIPDNYAQIQVIDTGIGISPEFLPYVFDRFRQADSSSTRSYGGLGLGLAIVRHLVELHGGTVEADSQGEQQGATFTVKLPLSSSNSQPLYPPSPLPSFSSTPVHLGPSLLGVRVLVVDDEADSRDFISTVLQQCQAEVEAVSSVKEALQVIYQWQPDVLVSDIGMPEEDGYSLIRKLRSQPPEQGGKIPAAALTAYARAEDRTRAIKEGYQLHLPKPIEPAELTTVVASLVGRT
ncbi:response regulator [Nostocaceae cyanobacterium CENA369]|uniref:histidine kinase n=1 Tax=Dendronalium phyllosphericum CENA369 TaxID=1725256 RepID=A0A8J7LHS7_9NOST|nr:ATP-binding protein [Dendronalium phyllosphericum]MBH8574344.1 response regulator [Dendronalium phyllosphericum CENA369]